MEAESLCELIDQEYVELKTDLLEEFAIKNGVNPQSKRFQRYKREFKEKTAAQTVIGIMAKVDSVMDIPSNYYLESIQRTTNYLLNTLINKSRNKKRTYEYTDQKELKNLMQLHGFYNILIDLAMIGVTTSAGIYTSLNYGSIFSIPLYASTALLARNLAGNFLNDTSHIHFTFPRCASIASSLVPSAIFYYKDMMEGNPELIQSAKMYLGIPASFLTAGILLPFLLSVYQHKKVKTKTVDLKSGKHRLNWKTKDKLKRLSTILEEISILQKSPDIKPNESLDEFEQVGIGYLKGELDLNKLRESRKKAEGERSNTFFTLVKKIKSRVKGLEPLKLVDGLNYREDTFNYVSHLGFENELAKRIARSLTKEETESSIGLLTTALAEDHLPVLFASPSFLFLKGNARTEYIDQLYQVLRITGDRFKDGTPIQFTPSENPTAYSTIEGLTYLINRLDEEQPEQNVGEINQGLIQAGYSNVNLLRTILIKGFKLGSARPYIGMGYMSSNVIKRDTAKSDSLGPHDMKEYRKTMGKLMQDGVIKTDKLHKSTACYSINQRIGEIQNPALREYVSQHLYGGLKITSKV